jgi:hypothetical protein
MDVDPVADRVFCVVCPVGCRADKELLRESQNEANKTDLHTSPASVGRRPRNRASIAAGEAKAKGAGKNKKPVVSRTFDRRGVAGSDARPTRGG